MQESPLIAPTPPAAERQRLIRDSLVNNLSVPVTAVVGILLVPVMLGALGRDDYGLWIIATSLSGIITAIDFGVHWSVTRAVSADPDCTDADSAGFVRSAGNVYVLLGVAGCTIIGGAGLFSGGLRVPEAGRGTAIFVFWLVGATFFLDRIGAFGSAVLAGLRRFDLVNIIAVISTVVWAVGAVALLASGGTVVAVAACMLAVTALKGAGTLWAVARLRPAYRFRPDLLRWGPLRRHLSFAMTSLLADLLTSVSWNCAPVLIGYVSGPSAAVPFYVGQKFPVAVSTVSCRAAEVLFPAASESRHDPARSREVLGAGARWLAVMVLPLSVLLFFLAPEILAAWVGSPPPGSVWVMRLMALTVLAEGFVLAPVHLLWGRGAMRPVVLTHVVQGAGVVALTLALVPAYGAPGAAAGMLIPITVTAAVLFRVASGVCGVKPWRLAADSLSGLTLPVLASAACARAVFYLGGDGRAGVAVALAAGGLAYAAGVLLLGGNADEKRLARDTLYRLKAWRRS